MCTGTWPGFCSLRPVEGGYTHRRGGRAGRGWAILSGLIRPVACVLLGVAFASRVGLAVLSQLVDVDSILGLAERQYSKLPYSFAITFGDRFPAAETY